MLNRMDDEEESRKILKNLLDLSKFSFRIRFFFVCFEVVEDAKSDQIKRIDHYGFPSKSGIEEEKEFMKKKLPEKIQKQWEIFFFLVFLENFRFWR